MALLQLPKQLHPDFANPTTKPVGNAEFLASPIRPKYYWDFSDVDRVVDLANGPGSTEVTIQSGAPESVILQQGRAVRFDDAINDRMASGTINHGIGTGDWTVLVHFIKRPSADSFDGLLSNGDFSPAWMYTVTNGPWGMFDGATKNANSTLVDGNEYVLCSRRIGTSVNFFLNGKADGTATSSANCADNIIRFANASASASRDTSVDMFWVAIYDKALSDAEIEYIYRNRGTWAYEPEVPAFYYVPDAAGGAFTLTADSGSYTYTGTANDLRLDALLGADSGSYSYSGTDVDLITGYSLQADAGSYIYTGTDAALTLASAGNFTLSADTGAYTYSGTDIALEASFKLDASSGAYTYSGTDATLSFGYAVSADSGTYTYTGTDIGFSLTIKLSADSGAYTYTGPNAILRASGQVWTTQADAVTTWTEQSDSSTIWNIQ
jgi:hypothetical protein